MKLGPITNAEFMYALSKGVYTRTELAQETGLTPGTVGQYLAQLRKKPGLIHIAEWRRHEVYHHISEVFKLGPGKDAPRPRSLTQAERQRNYYNRKREKKLQLAMLGKGTIEQSANGLLRITANV